MMDENRCLIDVINNPELLQSFLESESSNRNIDTNTTGTPPPASPIPASATPASPKHGTPKPSSPTPVSSTPACPTPASPIPASATPASPKNGTPKPSSPMPVSSTPDCPTPASPIPASATPASPKHGNPKPSSPTPVSSTPACPTPASATPAPVTPAPVTPAPVTPAPVTPAPVTPTPVTPAINEEIKSTAPSTPSTSTIVSTPSSTPSSTPVTTAPKRAPRRSAPKTSKAKNNKNDAPTPTSVPQSQTPQMQTQFVSNPSQPQIFLQSTNTGIRQPTILTQQQRVVQIQTPNGPMYFAIAPGPTMNNNNVMNQQTIYVAGQQNSQQHIMLPPSQTMMMPRVPNQLILNRPLNSPGQLVPGQQQFIQIQTQNGPMLLALPTQSAPQPINNSMIDYNNQVQHQQQQQQQPPQSQHIQSSKYVSGSKQTGSDLDDLLLDCGILPEERTSTTLSPGSKISQSPSLQQNSSPIPTMTQMNPTMPPMSQMNTTMQSPMNQMNATMQSPINQMNTTMQSPMNQMNTTMQNPMGQVNPNLQSPINQSSPLPNNPPQQQPIPNYAPQPMRQQPIRITIGPDGQMIMQPAVYGSIRPVLATGPMAQGHLNVTNNMIPSNPPMVAMTMSPAAQPNTETKADNNGKKQTSKGKETTAKRSRSKKSDVDKFPTLKTPKLQEQQQKQKQMQAVTVVPIIVGDQNKTVLAGSDVRANVAQLPSSVSLAKIVAPVIQPGPIHPSVPTANLDQNDNTQIGDSKTVSQVASVTTAPTSSIPSGNVTTNLLQKPNYAGTVESNPHISSSLMPTPSLTVDTPKIEQNGLITTRDGQLHPATIQGVQATPITATIVFNAQAQMTTNHQISQNQQLINSQAQQVTRQTNLRVQSILNQLNADQNAASNPQTKQSFRSLEDACKRLLRYHVFNARGVEDSQIKKFDQIFEAASESLIKRKNLIYDKFRILSLKNSMKNVPLSEEVMLEQVFVNDESSYLKKERESFKDHEAHLECLAFKQAKLDQSKGDSGQDHFAFGDSGQDFFSYGENSPKQTSQDDSDSAAHSRDVEDWLLADKWGKSHYPSVPDSEAATAIESILNDELS